MRTEKYNTLFSRLSGGIALLSWIMAHFISGIPRGYVNIFETIKDLIELSDMRIIFDSSIWVLCCLAWLFAGIALLIAKANLSSTAMMIFGSVFFVYEIVGLILFSTSIMDIFKIVTPIAIVLAGLSMLTRKEFLYFMSIILGVVGAFLYGIFRINLLMANAYDYLLEGEITGRSVQAIIWIVVYFMLAAVIVLAVLACYIQPTEPGLAPRNIPLQSRVPMRHCPGCGEPFSPDSRFCGNCGRKLT